jgi:DNA-binding LacI/PurR family transcriptional regulator
MDQTFSRLLTPEIGEKNLLVTFNQYLMKLFEVRIDSRWSAADNVFISTSAPKHIGVSCFMSQASPKDENGPYHERPETTIATWIKDRSDEAPPDRPLPTTRELGKRFGVANATAFRVLQRLAQEGDIWQHPVSGRYYPKGARVLFDRPTPIACLIRRLELDSEQYRELMEGISQGCGALQRTMLLWHDELLVNHPDPHNPPIFATAAQQRAILSTFLDRHGKSASSFLLDHLWGDDAIRAHATRLRSSVVLVRSCGLRGVSNIHADFRAGAFKALAHLLDRSYERIIPIEPFSGDPSVTEFLGAFEQAATDAGCQGRMEKVTSASTEEERAELIQRLSQESRRTALVCPEDNVTVLLLEGVRKTGIPCPQQIGLLSVMGTDYATKAGITCLRYDFRAMGRLAVNALTRPEPVRQAIEPQLIAGSTT